uniref:SCP domain-containing protein n=1 Tax=Steinernema glaseri TaxID=37863 RepID=A0A1I7ZJJ9_9BILA
MGHQLYSQADQCACDKITVIPNNCYNVPVQNAHKGETNYFAWQSSTGTMCDRSNCDLFRWICKFKIFRAC